MAGWPWLVGLALGLWWRPDVSGGAIAIALVGLVMALTLRPAPWLRAVLVATSLVPLSAANAEWRQPVPPPGDLSLVAPLRWSVFEGQVVSDPVTGSVGAHYLVAVRRLVAPRATTAGGRVWVHSPDVPRFGAVVRLEGSLQRPEVALNPGESDWSESLARRGVWVTCGASRVAEIQAPSASLTGMAIALRHACLDRFSRYLDRPLADFAGSLILGAGVSPVQASTSAEFRDLGLAHLLAVSGAQVLIVLHAVRRLLALLRMPRRFAGAIAALSVLGFVMVSGASSSVVRAAFMALGSLMAWGLRRRLRPLTSLGLATFVLLVAVPAWWDDLGFQFSVLATFALLHTAPLIAARMQRLPGWLVSQLAPSLAALLWVTPLQFAAFGQLSPWALLANLATLPFVEGLTLGGVGLLLSAGGAALLPLLDVPTRFAFGLYGVAMQLMLGGVHLMHALPGAAWSLPVPPLALACVLYACLLAAVMALARDRLALSGAGFLAMIGLIVAWAVWPRAGFQLTVLSVGQGDAIAFQTPAGDWGLMDLGPAGRGSDAGDRVVVPYLRRMGVHALRWIWVSHPHRDHVGGLGAVLEAFPGAEVWEAGPLGPEENALLAELLRHGTAWRVLRVGDRVDLGGGCGVRILGPERCGMADINNGGLVAQLSYGRVRLMLEGDAEGPSERAMIDRWGDSLRSDVLKVAHHGSHTSSLPEFLARVRPRASVISVGAHNVFHHPGPEVVARLRHWGPVARTDRDGALTLRTDGVRWTLESVRNGLLTGGSVL